MSLGDYFDPSDEADEAPDHAASPKDELADVDGVSPTRDVIIHGDITGGEWEAVLLECHKEVRVWTVSTGPKPSLETLQTQETAAAETLKQMEQATQVFVLPEEQKGFTSYGELAEAAMASPEDSIVVLDPKSDEQKRLKMQITDSGAVVVASLEDAALYIACAV